VTTATKIIRGAMSALGLRGASQRVGGGDLEHCLERLNTMIDGWNLGPTFAFNDLETVFALPAVSSVTIGPGMQIDIPRPTRIEISSFTRVATIDHPLDVIDRETYNSIFQKTIGTAWPVACFFDGGNPTANLFFWPQAQCELHLVTRLSAGNFANVTTDYQLPAGYERAFIFSLAEEIAPDYETAVPDSVARRAAGARRMVKRANLTVPQLDVPLPTQQRGWYTKAEFLGGL